MSKTSEDRLKVINRHLMGNKKLFMHETSAGNTSKDNDFPKKINSVVPRKR